MIIIADFLTKIMRENKDIETRTIELEAVKVLDRG